MFVNVAREESGRAWGTRLPITCTHFTSWYVFCPCRHHAMNSAGILLYALTSFISGFVSVHMFKKLGGHNWVWNVILTSSLFSVPFFVVWSFLNTVAWAYQSTQALPFTTIVFIIFIWIVGAHMYIRVVCVCVCVHVHIHTCMHTCLVC